MEPINWQIVTWQLVAPDNWIFGEKVRGIVRKRRAEIYYNEEWTGKEGGWRWMVFKDKMEGGYAPSRGYAVYYCETALGLISTWEPSYEISEI